MSDKKTNAVRIAEKNKVKYELLSYEVDEEHLDAISVAEKIKEEIKYIRGGCSPIGMKKIFPTLIDKKAENLEYIIVSAGKRGMQLKMEANALKELISADFEDLIKGE